MKKMSFKRTITFVSIFLKYLIHIHTGREGVPSETKIVGMVFWNIFVKIFNEYYSSPKVLKLRHVSMLRNWRFSFFTHFYQFWYFLRIFRKVIIGNKQHSHTWYLSHAPHALQVSKIPAWCQNIVNWWKNLDFLVFCYQKIWIWCQLKMVLVLTKWQISSMNGEGSLKKVWRRCKKRLGWFSPKVKDTK